MTRIISAIAAFLLGAHAQAAEPPALDIRPATEIALEDFLWQSRLILVFADSQYDPRFREQIDLLGERADNLLERDVIVITDTDPAARSALRIEFRPHGFMMVLIGKDGSILLRKPSPWAVREITRSIDKTPLRQQEIDAAR